MTQTGKARSKLNSSYYLLHLSLPFTNTLNDWNTNNRNRGGARGGTGPPLEFHWPPLVPPPPYNNQRVIGSWPISMDGLLNKVCGQSRAQNLHTKWLSTFLVGKPQRNTNDHTKRHNWTKRNAKQPERPAKRLQRGAKQPQRHLKRLQRYKHMQNDNKDIWNDHNQIRNNHTEPQND